MKAGSNPIYCNQSPRVPWKVTTSWYAGAEPHVTCSLSTNPHHVVICLISSLMFILKILNSFGIFKEPDCKLFNDSTFPKTSDTEGLSVAPSRVSLGFILPLDPIPPVSTLFCWLVAALVPLLRCSSVWLFLLEVGGF